MHLIQNIKFDLDGCLVDFEGHLARVLLASYNAKIVPTGDFNITTNPELTTRQFCEAFRTVYRDYKQTDIYPGVTELFEKLYAKSQQPVHIVTARPYDCAHHTYMLVARIARVPVTISFANAPFSKLDYLNGTHFFVEDRKSTALAIAARGKQVFLPDRPWNATLTHDTIIRISGVEELIPHVDLFIQEKEGGKPINETLTVERQFKAQTDG